MKVTRCALVVLLLSSAACSKGPSAMGVCAKIEASGVGAACHESKPEGLGAAAVERADFNLPSVPGKTGQVLRFDSDARYTDTEEAFGKVALLAGPHRYGNAKARIFVQANDGLSLDDGKKLRAVVEGL